MIPEQAEIAIRAAQTDDIPALHALIESAYRGDAARAGWTHEADLLGGQRIDLEGLADILADPDQYLLIATRADGTAAGCVEVTDKTPGLAYLGMLSVTPHGQAQGLGKRLISAAEQFARDQLGAARMEMTVIRQRSELISYYIRRGYQPTGEERPFPYGDARFGAPRTDDLAFVVLARTLT